MRAAKLDRLTDAMLAMPEGETKHEAAGQLLSRAKSLANMLDDGFAVHGTRVNQSAEISVLWAAEMAAENS
eukprot:SAG31_NODE_599_length_13649_cov_9.930775_2_plen_71_part_00